MIDRLFDLNAVFQSKPPLSYTCYPDDNPGYNSNSFAVALLLAAGIPLPDFLVLNAARFPGVAKPVPPAYFQP